MFTAARDVATRLGGDPRTPSYYCAELVANAYGRVFTRAEMVPPRGAGYGIGDAIEEPRWFARLAELLSSGSTASITRGDGRGQPSSRHWPAGTGTSSSMPSGASTRSAFFMLGRRGEGSAKAPDRLRESAPGHPSLAHTDVVVPHALVTPRMLWSVFGRDAAGNDLIRRITRPPRR